MQHIRNFSIIAHIDHGKSTLADRIIQLCGALSDREMQSQILDSMDLERERGITIKAQTASLFYTSKDQRTYNLNLIDTPGHVDFSYEVSRSLAACEGALLVVDANQGVEAQTVANCYMAIDLGLEIVPIINKVDLPTADIDRTIKEISEVIGIEATDANLCSAKNGFGVRDIIEKLIRKIPPPKGDPQAPLQALIIDSWFDRYVGVVILIRIVNGTVHVGDKIQMMSNGMTFFVEQVGIFVPYSRQLFKMCAGQVGFLIAGIKDLNAAKVGDTVTLASRHAPKPLHGFKEIKPQVFAGLYPVNPTQSNILHESIIKLKLNDAALQFEPEVSQALGFGFRCGFLGALHMEIVRERLEREFDMDLITTTPTVIYQVKGRDKKMIQIENPSKMPDSKDIDQILEPIAVVTLYLPKEYIGAVIALCMQKRGIQKDMKYYGNQVQLTYEIPMAEIVLNFFDRLKSVSHGYASMEYEFLEYRVSDMVKLDILINSTPIDSLSNIVHRSQARYLGCEIATKMRELIPRQMFDIVLQVAIGSRILSREIIKAVRKNVLAKCYGGDITRKKKLLEKQKQGKRRMKRLGNIEIPKEAFLAILQLENK